MFSAPAAARSLYRQLFRKSKALPRSVREHYRGSIRTGFVAHGDEDDDEVLKRIYAQAVRDADWVLNKYKSLPNTR
ncbi:hypothetical protein D9Q98_001194 [Chlorella vulgaris]|uniref:LYR motif-containing protein 9 n=1 Tax=Chlorella vulgaris TaxID=3077 RepID=A0A9D4TZQ2_CHLVU|nr:hypothetical protein D9Q98_001194 [Chlorella vulgaris]